ncbi:DNA helicase RecQ [Microvirga brassicacearum]|uniref:DNA helicase RecQ n=1 Tax=Microvirga brassicacearum TaxID=2580413 RepID=A0A5N3PF28_9HYPH|nr:DNA helicase RecQ [Microvirga brassicacearum]KAB0268314.1 DNA helicase RecQ [Microvirga brassicacearum]
MTDPLKILHDVFGFSTFRDGQEDIVRSVLAGHDVLAVMPTGAGKSLCYQLPTLVREGLTLVVSPLIALMRDQVAALRHFGVEAGSLNSANDPDENRRVADAVRDGRMRLLYASPERLANSNATEWLARSGVSLLAIDEAHCVSQWGHDFRPEYALLGDVRRRLGGVQTIALTATADVSTRGDIMHRLFETEPRIFIHGFDRPNLRLAMQSKDQSKRQLFAFLDKHRRESGIIYCASRNATEKLADSLCQAGYRAMPYHAGMAQADRAKNQDIFLQEDGVVMVATVAFGMGIDKPDVRFVAHAALPKSIEAYYQEIGRAGRDGEAADTLTLYGLDDMRLRRSQIEDSDASEEQKRVERQRLNALVALCEAPRCRRQTLLAYFGETTEPCGNCDLCIDGVVLFDGTIEAQKLLSAIVRTGERFGTEHIISILMGEETDAILRLGHNGLKTFGVGKDRSKTEWRSLLRQIYALGLIALELSEYGRWTITERGVAVLKGLEPVELRADVLMKPRERKSRRGVMAAESVVPGDDPLLLALKTLRTRLAKEEAVPAYVIFSDRSLVDMAVKRPKSAGAFGEIHGVGQAKLDRYADAFLTVVREHAD